MAQTLGVKTTFTAVDRFSAIVQKMGVGVSTFASRATVAFNRVERAERKMRGAISNAIGKFGQLGVAISGLAIATMIGSANIELDQNLASLASITGATAEQFKGFQVQIDKVSKSQKMFAGDTAKAFEVVGSVKPELLGNAEALSKVTESAIILSKATGMDLQLATENLVGTMNQFNLGASESARIMNVLAAGSLEGSAPVDKITESLTKFGTVANSIGVSVEQSVAMIEQLGAKNLYGAEAGTYLRNIMIKMSKIKSLSPEALAQLDKFGVKLNYVADSTIPINKRLIELGKISGDTTALSKVFGDENIVAGQILLQNAGKLKELTDKMTGTNVATTQAGIMTNTLSNRWNELVASFKNAVTSTNSENEALNRTKNALKWVADNMDLLIQSVTFAITSFGLMKLALGAYKLVMWAYEKTIVTATGKSWLFNSSLWANPITWIVLLVIALIVVIALLIIYWQDIVKWVKESDSWFAKIIRFAIYPLIILFNVLGEIISWVSTKFAELNTWLETSDSIFAQVINGMVDNIAMLWDWIVKFIDSAIQPFIEAFEKIGEVIDFFSEQTQKELGVDVNKKSTIDLIKPSDYDKNKALNPDAAKQENTNTNLESIMAKIGIDINDKSGQASVNENTYGIPVNLTKNLGWSK